MPAKSRSTGPFVAPITKLAYAPNAVFTDNEFLWQNQPQTTFATNIPMWCINTAVVTSLAGEATNKALAQPVPLQQGMTVSSISYRITQTALGTPTAQFVAIYDNAATPNLIETSGNLGSAARAANTTHTVALRRPVTIPVTNMYYIAIGFTASTIPTMLGSASGYSTNLTHLNPGLLGSAQTGLSFTATSGVAPSTITGVTTVNKMYWVAVQ